MFSILDIQCEMSQKGEVLPPLNKPKIPRLNELNRISNEEFRHMKNIKIL